MIHLFGSTTLCGEALRREIKRSFHDIDIINYSRQKNDYNYLDFNDLEEYKNYEFGNSSILVSFAPIWLFKKFISFIAKNNKFFSTQINGIIVCSSSSTNTKRYAFNQFDENLA